MRAGALADGPEVFEVPKCPRDWCVVDVIYWTLKNMNACGDYLCMSIKLSKMIADYCNRAVDEMVIWNDNF